MWYFIRWTLGTMEIDTAFACRDSALRFALAKGGVMFTKEEYEALMNDELSELC